MVEGRQAVSTDWGWRLKTFTPAGESDTALPDSLLCAACLEVVHKARYALLPLTLRHIVCLPMPVILSHAAACSSCIRPLCSAAAATFVNTGSGRAPQARLL